MKKSVNFYRLSKKFLLFMFWETSLGVPLSSFWIFNYALEAILQEKYAKMYGEASTPKISQLWLKLNDFFQNLSGFSHFDRTYCEQFTDEEMYLWIEEKLVSPDPKKPFIFDMTKMDCICELNLLRKLIFLVFSVWSRFLIIKRGFSIDNANVFISKLPHK